MHTGAEYALQACEHKYDNLKYDQYDCQAFAELVLKDIGVRKPDGSVYNWKGSNSMWRNGVSWKGTKEECIAKFGCIPVGAWAFIHAYDGGEKARGYNDDQGNASHVAIVVNQNQVRDSTKGSRRDGVDYRSLKDFNMIGLVKVLDYNETIRNIIEIDRDEVEDVYSSLQNAIKIIGGWLSK